jgi:uncharacterized YigZ family protein
MSDTYKTITAKSEGIYKQKGSKFLSFALPVSNINEINKIVKDYRRQFYDARHVCYAYKLGEDNKNFRSNDDGEPSGTAGRPILGQISSHQLTNILIIVVRYFGGILLGTSGLIVAYKEAAADALNQAEIIEKTIDINISVLFDYVRTNEVMKIIKDTDSQIISQNLDNLCSMELSIRKQNVPLLISKMKKITGIVIKNITT